MKKILGLDLGTNSIGWALIDKEEQKILGMGSRIIPMGTDKLDYEKGAGITKNADRRMARTIRKMNKRYKLRRNKLLFILNELGILPDQFQFKDGIPEPTKLQDLELLPIKKGTLQLNSLTHYQLRVNALSKAITPKDFGKILYQFNQLRGYAGGGNNDDNSKKKEDETTEEPEKKKSYEVITQKVSIINIETSDRTYKAKGDKNKGQELPLFAVTFLLNDEEKEGTTILQNLEIGKEEELEIRIKQTKIGENIIIALPQKTNWKKQMESTEDTIKTERLFVGQLLLKDLLNHKWTKVRNRVILRSRYQEEFDAIWKEQAKYHSILNNCSLKKLETIANYLYPGSSNTQNDLRKDAMEGGLKYIIKQQVIYYQRPLKSQTELISKCQFEKEEKVIATSNPLFQEFRCWKQINQLYIRSKEGVYNERKNKTIYKYSDRYLTNEQKNDIYIKLQNQKQVGFSDVAKIAGLKNDKTEYLNGLNVKAKLKGCDTAITIKKMLGDELSTIINQDKEIVLKIWDSIFDLNNSGNEYDVNSKKVSSLINILSTVTDKNNAIVIALKLAQNISYPRKYASLSAKAITNILPLMQLNPVEMSNIIKENFEKIKHAIDTGELKDGIEPYMVDYIDSNPNIIENGGMMDSFAASLVYGKHTIADINATVKNYHDIKYNPTRNLRNPIVEQITNEALQIIKAIWKEYKFNPEELEIRIELARDLKNSAAERANIYKSQLNNQKQNNRIKERLVEEKMPVTDENVLKYKLYEHQKYLSPYSGDTLAISLFDEYEIDHIIPKSRLFDDSISNKVLVEGFLNKEKGNRTSWEYISQQNTKYKIRSIQAFIDMVNDNYFGRKKKNLLLEKIPTDFVERQIKQTQYIALAVKAELAQIVGSNNVKSSTGEITSFLRSRWGLRKLFMELTESRFKQMELWDSSNKWVNRYFDEEQKRNVYEIKYWSKRYDHRHHSIDALVVALTEKWHIDRLNNLNKELQDWLYTHKNEINLEVKEDETVLEAFFNLEEKRRDEIQKGIDGFRKFDSPFSDLVNQARIHLDAMVVSHKPKDNLTIQFNEKTKKKEIKIRSALHEATLYGKHNGQDTKTMSISNLTAKDIQKIVDPVLRAEINKHRSKSEYGSMKEAFSGEGLKAFNKSRFQRKKPQSWKPPVFKVKIYYNTKEVKESSLQRLYENNNKLSVKTGSNYLFLVMATSDNKRVFDIVSLYDAADIAKREWKNQSENFMNKIYEEYIILNKKYNADKVLFALQQNELVYLPENVDDPTLNFTSDEFAKWISQKENKTKFNKRVYKVVKFTGKDCFFVPHNYANTISIAKDLNDEQKARLKNQYGEKKIPKKELNFEEFGSFGTSAKTEVNENFVKILIDKTYTTEPMKIQDYCIKIKTDWLGKLQLV
ncbi:MAG: HNH endonuclease domain-containing protein [Sediminibacterium sp.]|nr:HNH endonuclease domain-containing protein [Sediminibacterium sp.]MDP3127313.1 HNH endonuclease domain-containing protein [Sediminibacterium sp.]